MSLAKRKCLYSNEKKLSYFPTYSEPNCFLECSWERAKESCGCVPWYILSLFPNTHLCERFGNNCFKEAITKRYQVKSEQIYNF